MDWDSGFCIPWGIVGVAIVLVMDFEVGQREQERRFGRAQEALRALRHEVGAILAREMNRLAGRIPDVAFVSMRRPLELVRRLPQIRKAAAILRRDPSARLFERHSLGSVQPALGKFRSFLLACLKNFLANERERANAQCRGGGQTLPVPRP